MMRWTPKFHYALRTDVGLKRQNNEDACVASLCPSNSQWENRGHLFVVADGMGGHEVGELASKIAVDTLPHIYFKSSANSSMEALREALNSVNGEIHERGSQNRDFMRMGTTCTAITFQHEGFLVGHVGDSRAYRIRDERIDQLTFDHTLAWEQKRHPDKFQVDEETASKNGHVLTRCLGPDEQVNVDMEGPHEYEPGDIFVLCTDGIGKYLSDVEIGIIAKYLPPNDAVNMLINLANLRGGADNATIVIVQVVKASNQDDTQEWESNNESLQIHDWLHPRHILIGLGIILAIVAGLTVWQALYPLAITSITAAIIILLIGIFFTKKKTTEESDLPEKEEDSEDASTIYFRPYRTAPVRLSIAFIEKLQVAHQQTIQTAQAGQWEINWSQHDSLVNQIPDLLAAKKYRTVLRNLSKALEILLSSPQNEHDLNS